MPGTVKSFNRSRKLGKIRNSYYILQGPRVWKKDKNTNYFHGYDYLQWMYINGKITKKCNKQQEFYVLRYLEIYSIIVWGATFCCVYCIVNTVFKWTIWHENMFHRCQILKYRKDTLYRLDTTTYMKNIYYVRIELTLWTDFVIEHYKILLPSHIHVL